MFSRISILAMLMAVANAITPVPLQTMRGFDMATPAGRAARKYRKGNRKLLRSQSHITRSNRRKAKRKAYHRRRRAA